MYTRTLLCTHAKAEGATDGLRKNPFMGHGEGMAPPAMRAPPRPARATPTPSALPAWPPADGSRKLKSGARRPLSPTCPPMSPEGGPREARGRPEGAEGAPPPPTIHLRLCIFIQYDCRRFILHVCVGRAGRLWCSFLTQVLLQLPAGCCASGVPTRRLLVLG